MYFKERGFTVNILLKQQVGFLYPFVFYVYTLHAYGRGFLTYNVGLISEFRYSL